MMLVRYEAACEMPNTPLPSMSLSPRAHPCQASARALPNALHEGVDLALGTVPKGAARHRMRGHL